MLNNSKDFNGSGLATYPNGDTYDGPFKDGVSYKTFIQSSYHFQNSFAMVIMVFIHTNQNQL